MVLILDNSSADIAIVMPKPDLSRDEFSYSNLYCFDYDGAAAGVTGASVESSPLTVSGNGGDDNSVSCKICMLSHDVCAFQLFFSPIYYMSKYHTIMCMKSSANNTNSVSTASTATACTFESAFQELAKQNSFNDLAAAAASSSSSSASRNRSSIGGYKAMEASSNHHNTSNSESSNNDKITRDPRNGAFTFQVHAEYDLLLQIQKDLDAKRPSKSSKSSLSSLALSDVDLTKIILKSVDDYCYGKQWMYHIGSEKGKAISRFLKSGVESWLKNKRRSGKVCRFNICYT